MEEIWRTIEAFPDYAVSNVGNIKRITASAKNKKKLDWFFGNTSTQGDISMFS